MVALAMTQAKPAVPERIPVICYVSHKRVEVGRVELRISVPWSRYPEPVDLPLDDHWVAVLPPRGLWRFILERGEPRPLAAGRSFADYDWRVLRSAAPEPGDEEGWFPGWGPAPVAPVRRLHRWPPEARRR